MSNSRHKTSTGNEKGFTLPELMTTMAIVVILASVAFPALGSMIAGNKLNAAQENIIGTLKKARGMALSHSTIATVSIDAAARTVRLSVADNSFPAEILSLNPSVNIAASAVLNFSAQGTVSAASGVPAIALSSPGYASLSRRIINISPTGIVNASR